VIYDPLTSIKKMTVNFSGGIFEYMGPAAMLRYLLERTPGSRSGVPHLNLKY